MSVPVATALGRRDRMWPAVSASAVAHLLIIVWALVRREPPPIDLEQKPIVAKLVRLGEKRPEEWLPRKEAPPPPPAPPAPVPVSAPIAAAQPRPTAPAPSAKPAPAKPPAPSASLSSILSKVQRQVNERRYGSPDGDAAGDSEQGSEGDRYLALVTNALQAVYRVPATISERERMHLRATVVLYIEQSGKVSRYRFESRSGNNAYDMALERAIKEARLPPPPAEVRERYRRDGFGINFHI